MKSQIVTSCEDLCFSLQLICLLLLQFLWLRHIRYGMEAKIFLTIHKVHMYGYAHISFPLLCLTLQLFNQQSKSMECLLSTPLTSMQTTVRNSKAFGIYNSFPHILITCLPDKLYTIWKLCHQKRELRAKTMSVPRPWLLMFGSKTHYLLSHFKWELWLCLLYSNNDGDISAKGLICKCWVVVEIFGRSHR